MFSMPRVRVVLPAAESPTTPSMMGRRARSAPPDTRVLCSPKVFIANGRSRTRVSASRVGSLPKETIPPQGYGAEEIQVTWRGDAGRLASFHSTMPMRIPGAAGDTVFTWRGEGASLPTMTPPGNGVTTSPGNTFTVIGQLQREVNPYGHGAFTGHRRDFRDRRGGELGGPGRGDHQPDPDLPGRPRRP